MIDYNRIRQTRVHFTCTWLTAKCSQCLKKTKKPVPCFLERGVGHRQFQVISISPEKGMCEKRWPVMMLTLLKNNKNSRIHFNFDSICVTYTQTLPSRAVMRNTCFRSAHKITISKHVLLLASEFRYRLHTYRAVVRARWTP